MKRRWFVILMAFIFGTGILSGQELPDSVTYRIETNDGNTFVGRISYEDTDKLILETETFGVLTIRKADIKVRVVLSDARKVGKDYWLPNPQSSRYFWAPNGYGLQKGSSYYQNIWIFYNQVSFGLSDNFSFGGGMIPLFLFGEVATPVWIVPKISIPVVENKFNVGTGAFLGTLLGESTGAFGLLYGTATLGSRDQNTSLGLAYGFAGGDWMKIPIINLSSMIRTGPRGYFITENYLITAEGTTVALISAGGRSMIRNVGLDYSLWIPIAEDVGLRAIPFLGITVPLGRQ